MLAALGYGTTLPTEGPDSVAVSFGPDSGARDRAVEAMSPAVASMSTFGDVVCVDFRDGASDGDIDDVLQALERLGGTVDRARPC